MFVKEIKFIEEVKNLSLGVFTVRDISRIIGKDRNYTSLYLKRLYERGIIKRIEKGKYSLPHTDPLVIATNLVVPSYVSFLSGLAYHHRTTQIPVVTQVVTSRVKKNVDVNGKVKYIKFNRNRMFGFKKERIWNGYTSVGEIEKVIVDGLFLPKYCPISETFAAMEGADTDKLIRYGKKMDSIVTLKRLGYLLSLYGIDVYHKLRGRINNRYNLLNPSLPPSGEKDRTWRLKVNEVL